MTAFASQITFLDFEDYESGKDFMSRVLQLENIYDIGWASVYGTAGKAYLGVVDRRHGEPLHGNGILISLTTDHIEEWHRHIADFAEVSPIAEVQDAGLRSFFFTGPEGYHFEIQQFGSDFPRSIFY